MANSTAAAVPGPTTRLPTFCTVNTSPGPLWVMTCGSTRESAQVIIIADGDCPSASPVMVGRIASEVLSW